MCYDKQTRKARGFGFINFDSEEVADKVLENQFHYLKGTKVETTKAKPRSSMDSGGWGHSTGALLMTMVECTHPTTDHLSLGVALI